MKHLFSRSKNHKRGFTLTELAVVMVLLGLLIVLATSVTLIVNRTQKISKLDSKSENDILKLETAFKDWLALYDESACTISVSDKRIDVTYSYGTDEYIMEYSQTDKLLSYTENVGADPHASKTEIKLTSVSDVTFDVYNGNIIYCKAEIADGDYTHTVVVCARSASIKKIEEKL